MLEKSEKDGEKEGNCATPQTHLPHTVRVTDTIELSARHYPLQKSL